MIIPDFCCASLSKMYGHDWKRSWSEGNSSALPLTTSFEYCGPMVDAVFTVDSLLGRGDRLWYCYQWGWLSLSQRKRDTWRCTGSSPGLSDSDVRKWFSDLKGNLISSEKHQGQNTSCIFFLLLIAADRMILFREVACPWLLGVHSLLVATLWLVAL